MEAVDRSRTLIPRGRQLLAEGAGKGVSGAVGKPPFPRRGRTLLSGSMGPRISDLLLE